jgi:hypothetical protein
MRVRAPATFRTARASWRRCVAGLRAVTTPAPTSDGQLALDYWRREVSGDGTIMTVITPPDLLITGVSGRVSQLVPDSRLNGLGRPHHPPSEFGTAGSRPTGAPTYAR